jgi:hypothetical protein
MRRKIMKIIIWLLALLTMITYSSCNDGISTASGGRKINEGKEKRNRSQRTVIDSAEYFDFTGSKYNARTVVKEDMLYALNGATYSNGNSTIKIKMREGEIEISSDKGSYNGKQNCQVYGVFGFDIQAASEDCLYIRKNQKKEGFLMIDGIMYRNDAVPDLAVCLPLYGYSRNRIEVSSVMDGYIIMPSGTYWKK